MAQKKKTAQRVPRASEPRMYGDGKPSEAATPVVTATPVTTATPQAQAQPATRTAGATPRAASAPRQGTFARVDKISDYSYVTQDLRRLGITAVGILGLLVVLGILLP